MKELIGITINEARIKAEALGKKIRIGHEDGNDFILTRDYDTNRVTVSIVNGIVVKAEVG